MAHIDYSRELLDNTDISQLPWYKCRSWDQWILAQTRDYRSDRRLWTEEQIEFEQWALRKRYELNSRLFDDLYMTGKYKYYE